MRISFLKAGKIESYVRILVTTSVTLFEELIQTFQQLYQRGCSLPLLDFKVRFACSQQGCFLS